MASQRRRKLDCSWSPSFSLSMARAPFAGPNPGSGRRPRTHSHHLCRTGRAARGGLPRGRISEVIGPATSGKLTLAAKVIASAHRDRDAVAAWVDTWRTCDRRLHAPVRSRPEPSFGGPARHLGECAGNGPAPDREPLIGRSGGGHAAWHPEDPSLMRGACRRARPAGHAAGRNVDGHPVSDRSRAIVTRARPCRSGARKHQSRAVDYPERRRPRLRRSDGVAQKPSRSAPAPRASESHFNGTVRGDGL